ncbi:7789_t:CDS:1 [Funneliformis geosporum]|uniref:14622_t:CDS:1 n=1 Tax=Funneliformis geosporum TaxID=1117311 RepID=A0A9W4SSA3_9GLOM|nr:7789_t:CDS:1 [Funneliformis geosporum]CAI2179728.1 14622_t:CDS:1 [Funneliformis geosporum]
MSTNNNNQPPTFSSTGNNNPNFQHNDNGANTAAHSAPHVTAHPAPHFTVFECYLPSNDGRIYYVCYTELSPNEITRRLNNGIDLSHVPEHHIPHHNRMQSLIQQQIQDQHSVAYQQNNGQHNTQQPDVVISGNMQDIQIAPTQNFN